MQVGAVPLVLRIWPTIPGVDLVLRFLAEDVWKELDLVLDSIIRAITHRGSASSIGNIITVPAVLRMAGVPVRR